MKRTKKDKALDMYEVPFTHLHYTKGFTVMNKHPETTHACLRAGYWCWSNLLERPLDLISYIKREKK